VAQEQPQRQHGCVEVALDKTEVAVRDSKHPNGPVLLFDAHEWEAFVAGVQNGEFEHTSERPATAPGVPRRRGLRPWQVR
jgi:Domain of unknown function (DUF397)